MLRAVSSIQQVLTKLVLNTNFKMERAKVRSVIINSYRLILNFSEQFFKICDMCSSSVILMKKLMFRTIINRWDTVPEAL